MNGPIRRITYGLFAAFGILMLATTYIQAVASSRYRSDPANARVLLREGGQERGAIVDRNGEVLAISVLDEGGGRTFDRTYPTNELFAHPVGYSAVLFGQTALEREYSSVLRSRQDLTVSDLLTRIFGGDLRPNSLRLTLDAELQRVAIDALGDQRGAVAAVNPQTGEVLAYVSSPSFDPNRVSDPAYAIEIEDDALQPRLDRVANTTYPPASVFKLIVAAEALEQGFTVDSSLPDPVVLELPGSSAVIFNASKKACDGGGTVVLMTALARSCNIQFAQLAIDLGPDAIQQRAEAFGFNTAMDLELPTINSVFLSNLDLAALAQSAIGERDVQASPLQMLNVVSAIANRGQLMTPYFVDAIFDADKLEVSVTEPTIAANPISAQTAEALKQMMIEAVEHGTAGRAVVNGVTVAGKTGTSETGPHVWFVGFAPAEDPLIAIVVLVENGGNDGTSASGGGTAAPIAQRVIAQWLSP